MPIWTPFLLTLTACWPGAPQPGDGVLEPSECAEGYGRDGEFCVFEACGTGTWGELELDEDTVYVDIEAAEGGDGSIDAPLRGIQAGLDLAGSEGGGLVVVAAGTYPETLRLSSDHAGVDLAGRCRELVLLDASVGDAQTAGIDIDALYGDVSLSGVSVVGSSWIGVLVRSGMVRLARSSVEESATRGVAVYRGSLTAPSSLLVEDSRFTRNAVIGLQAWDSGAQVSLLNVEISDNVPSDAGDGGYGIEVLGGASLSAVDCEIAGNSGIGIIAYQPGTEVTLVHTVVRNTVPDGTGELGYGISVHDGAKLNADGCAVAENTVAGLSVQQAGTVVSLEDTVVRDTRPDQDGRLGFGINVWYGAEVTVMGGEVSGNTTVGITAAEPGTEVTLVDTVVRDTHPNPNGVGGCGIEVSGGAALTARDCVVARNTCQGLLAYEAGTQVSLINSEILDTLSDQDDELGFGIEVHVGAVVAAEGCAIVGNTAIGIGAAESGTEVTLVDTVVRDTIPDGDGEDGIGIGVEAGATLEAIGCDVARNCDLGIGARSQGTQVLLVDTLVRDTHPDWTGEGGYGIQATEAASIMVEDCEVSGNTGLGVHASGPGSAIFLEDTIIRDTCPDGNGESGAGIDVSGGALLSVERCEVTSNTTAGLGAWDAGTQVALIDTSVLDTHPQSSGQYGYGMQVSLGATLAADGCEFTGNSGVGIVAFNQGTQVEIRNSGISETASGFGEQGMAATALSAQRGASVHASGLIVADNEGPGLYAAGPEAYLFCTGCTLRGNHFAGAVAIRGSAMEIDESEIVAAVQSADLGGGVGVWAGEQGSWEAPSLIVRDSSIADNLMAGAWLAGDGSYVLSGNEVSGCLSIPHGVTTRCGSGVYATSTEAWDGTSGLMLSDNAIADNQGSGLFLDDAHALLGGNSWTGNAPDLWVQGEACHSPRDEYSDTPSSEICPEWDRPGCPLDFRLNLEVAELWPEEASPPAAHLAPTSRSPSIPHPALARPLRLARPVPLPELHPTPLLPDVINSQEPGSDPD